MKKIFVTALKSIIGGIVVVILGTIGIDAADHYNNFSESIIGRLINMEGKALCPPDMVYFPYENQKICIDKYENSTSGGCPYPIPLNNMDSQANINFQNCQAVSKANAVPWTNITQDQAIRACAKAGKRLPTNKEWQAAALGTPDLESGWTADDCQVNNNWDSQPGLTGSGKNCYAYSGAYDMIGNVWEWVNDSVVDGKIAGRSLPSPGYIKSLNASDSFPAETGAEPDPLYFNDYFWLKDTKTRGVLRGGYWNNKSEAGQYSLHAVNTAANFGQSIGFRCVK